jgi:serine/threonine protein phosphatase PrpC
MLLVINLTYLRRYGGRVALRRAKVQLPHVLIRKLQACAARRISAGSLCQLAASQITNQEGHVEEVGDSRTAILCRDEHTYLAAAHIATQWRGNQEIQHCIKSGISTEYGIHT